MGDACNEINQIWKRWWESIVHLEDKFSLPW